MAVTTTNVSVTYTGSNSVGPFSFNFSISTPAALVVIQNGVTLASTSYRIAPVNNNYDNGGLVTLNAPVPAGQTLILKRMTPLTQGSVFYDNLPLPMNQFENGLDKLTEIVQEQAAQIAATSVTAVTAGTGITITGNGTPGNPYVIAVSGSTAPLSITSFTGGQAGEVGQAFNNPAFADTYTGTPTGGNIVNTAGISSPYGLASPFTNANIVGTFAFNVDTTVTFTLTLSNGTSSPTATQAITWGRRLFGGVGPAGATAMATASGSSAVLSNASVLGTAQLGAENVGQTFGPYAPSGQCVYLLLTGSGHTFIDAASGFPMAFNAPRSVSFVNQYGVNVQMYLYQSTNPLTGNFLPRISS